MDVVRLLRESEEAALYKRRARRAAETHEPRYSLAMRARDGTVAKTPLTYMGQGSSNVTFAIHDARLLLRVSLGEFRRGTKRFEAFDAAMRKERRNMQLLARHGVGPALYYYGYARSRKGDARAVRYIALMERFDKSLDVSATPHAAKHTPRVWAELFMLHDVELALMDLYVRASALMRCVDTKSGNVVVRAPVDVELRLIDVDAAYCGVIRNPQHGVVGCVHTTDFYAALGSPTLRYTSPILAASVSLLIHCVQAASAYEKMTPKTGFPYVRTARMMVDHKATLMALLRQDYTRDRQFHMALLREAAAAETESESDPESESYDDEETESESETFSDESGDATWRKTRTDEYDTAPRGAVPRKTAAGRIAHYGRWGDADCRSKYDSSVAVDEDRARDARCIELAFTRLAETLVEKETRVFAVCCGIDDGVCCGLADAPREAGAEDRLAYPDLYDAAMAKLRDNHARHIWTKLPDHGKLDVPWLLRWTAPDDARGVRVPSWSTVYWRSWPGRPAEDGVERGDRQAPQAQSNGLMRALMHRSFPVPPASLADLFDPEMQTTDPQRVHHAHAAARADKADLSAETRRYLAACAELDDPAEAASFTTPSADTSVLDDLSGTLAGGLPPLDLDFFA